MKKFNYNVSKDDFFFIAKKKFNQENFHLIQKAYYTSEKYHGSQKRLSGEPFIIHPLQVANVLLNIDMDVKTICAGLLHDVIEDTPYTDEDMIRDFDIEIMKLVKGVTKISNIKNKSREINTAENIRKIILATIKDVRIILIKLSDKLHNMQTIRHQSKEKANRIANETLNLYTPLAGRLGIYNLKAELEDLSFQVINPDGYNKIKREIKLKKEERESFINSITKVLLEKLEKYNIKCVIKGRAKHFYSIFKKMELKEKSISQIFDLRALRVITKETKDCYSILGIVHNLWVPVPGRFKDYIANPKSNMYQSLHTTVMAKDGRFVEIQIRTHKMDIVGEYGLAAHWLYKEKIETTYQDKLKNWFKDLENLEDSSEEFLQELQKNLNEKEVFAFTPKGKIIELPKGATILDFAFRIHTDIGLHTKLAKVNEKVMSLDTKIKSGDQIEIITDKNQKPSPFWLKIVFTASARHKIRSYLNKLKEKEETIEKEDVKPIQSKTNINHLIHKKISNKNKSISQIIVGGFEDVPTRLAACCNPLPGNDIIGFVSKKAVTIHKKKCLQTLNIFQGKKISVRWNYDSCYKIPVDIQIEAINKQGSYYEIVKQISRTQNILQADAYSKSKETTTNQFFTSKFKIEIEHLDELNELFTRLKTIKSIIEVRRI